MIKFFAMILFIINLSQGVNSPMSRYEIIFGGDEINPDFLVNSDPILAEDMNRRVEFPLSKGGLSIFREFRISDGEIVRSNGQKIGSTIYITMNVEPRTLNPGLYGTAVMLIDQASGAAIPVGRANLRVI